MLAYLERAPAELLLPERVALTALRIWAAEMRRDRCAIGLMRDLFQRFGAAGALWPAHNFFYWAAAHAARPLDLGCPCCGPVTDDEALLLAAAFADDTPAARAAMDEVLSPVAVMGGVRLSRALGSELKRLAVN